MLIFLESICRPLKIRDETFNDPITPGQKMFPTLNKDPYDVTEVILTRFNKKGIETNHNYLV